MLSPVLVILFGMGVFGMEMDSLEAPKMDISTCVSDYRKKLDFVFEFEGNFMKAKHECMQDCEMPADFAECFPPEMMEEVGKWVERTAQEFKDIVDNTGEYLINNCKAPTQSAVEKLRALMAGDREMKKRDENIKPMKCMKTLMFHLIPEEPQKCMTECMMEKLKLTADELKVKLAWCQNPIGEPPEMIKKFDLKRAALCTLHTCDMKTLTNAIFMEGGIVEFFQKMAQEMQNPEVLEKKSKMCKCLKKGAKAVLDTLVIGEGERSVDIEADWNCDEPFGLLTDQEKCRNLKLAKLERMLEILEE